MRRPTFIYVTKRIRISCYFQCTNTALAWRFPIHKTYVQRFRYSEALYLPHNKVKLRFDFKTPQWPTIPKQIHHLIVVSDSKVIAHPYIHGYVLCKIVLLLLHASQNRHKRSPKQTVPWFTHSIRLFVLLF